jgi:hypothetical protein
LARLLTGLLTALAGLLTGLTGLTGLLTGLRILAGFLTTLASLAWLLSALTGFLLTRILTALTTLVRIIHDNLLGDGTDRKHTPLIFVPFKTPDSVMSSLVSMAATLSHP